MNTEVPSRSSVPFEVAVSLSRVRVPVDRICVSWPAAALLTTVVLPPARSVSCTLPVFVIRIWPVTPAPLLMLCASSVAAIRIAGAKPACEMRPTFMPEVENRAT